MFNINDCNTSLNLKIHKINTSLNFKTYKKYKADIHKVIIFIKTKITF